MAIRVVPLAPVDSQFFGGRSELVVEAGNLFAVIRALEAIAPGFLKYAQTRAWFSVNGTIEGDWTATIPPDSEVIILPAIAGG
ncbi:MAG: hypothetical protein AB7U34_01650 [Novosphingobium sp.]